MDPSAKRIQQAAATLNQTPTSHYSDGSTPRIRCDILEWPAMRAGQAVDSPCKNMQQAPNPDTEEKQRNSPNAFPMSWHCPSAIKLLMIVPFIQASTIGLIPRVGQEEPDDMIFRGQGNGYPSNGHMYCLAGLTEGSIGLNESERLCNLILETPKYFRK